MEVLITVIIIVALIKATIVFIRYEPSIDIIKVEGTYIVLLWYNKYNWDKLDNKRTYIKLFEI